MRYLYALTSPLAISAACGTARLFEWGEGPRLLASALFAGQLYVAVANIVGGLYLRYRT